MSPQGSPQLSEILAHLDLLLESTKPLPLSHKHYKNYKAEVLEQTAASLNGIITADEIKERLLDHLRVSERFPDDAFDFIIRHGSSELRLDEGTRIFLEHHLNSLRMERASQGRLRSSSTHKRQQNQQLHVDPSNQTTPTIRRDITRNATLKSKGIRKPTKGNTIRSGNVAATADTSEFQCHRSQLRSKAVASDSKATIERVHLHKQKSGSSHGIVNTNEIPGDQHPAFPLDLESSYVKLSNTEFSIMVSELDHYRERCERAEQECEAYKQQTRLMECQTSLPQAMKTRLLENAAKINRLTRQIDELQAVDVYLHSDEVPHLLSDSHQLTSRYKALKGGLLELLVEGGFHEPPVGVLKHSSVDLGNLLSKVFGNDVLHHPETVSSVFPPLKVYELIQALTGAAIYEWIFASDYKSGAVGVTPLLQGYRKVIKTRCGEEVACKFEVAAHKSVIEDESYLRVMVNGLTETVTCRLIDALRPLFDTESQVSAIEHLQLSLHAVLRIAVEIRICGLVRAQDFELIWPPFGSPFNKNLMTSAEISCSADMKLVRLPVCPGLRAFPRKGATVHYGPMGTVKSSDMKSSFTIKALVLR